LSRREREESGFKTVPINRMLPRSFFTNVTNGATVMSGGSVPVRGIALGGDCGVSKVELSAQIDNYAGLRRRSPSASLHEGN
jgi:hypothetical protein